MFSKNYAKVALALLMALSVSTAQAGFYQTIGTASLQAESTQEATQSRQQNFGMPTEQAPEEKVDLTVTTPTKTEELTTWFNLLEHTYETEQKHRVISDDAAEKLNLLSGSGSDAAYCVRNLFPTITTVGKAGVAEELATGTNSVRNQNIIRYLVENQDTAERVTTALKKINDGMGLYLTFFKDMSKAEKETFDGVFFGSWLDKLGANKSTTALTGLRLFQRGWNGIGFTPFLTIGRWFIYNSIMNFTRKTYIKLVTNPDLSKLAETLQLIPENYKAEPLPSNLAIAGQSIKDGLFDTAIGHYPGQYATTIEDSTAALNADALIQLRNNCILKGEMPGYPTQLSNNKKLNFDGTKRYWSLGDNLKWTDGSKVYVGWLAFTYIFADVVHGYSAYRSAQNVKFDNTILENLQTRLMGVASIIEGLAELNAIAAESELQELIDLAQEIGLLIEAGESSTDLGYLVSHLQKNTFKGDASYFSNRPRILATYTLLQENKIALIPALRAAGTIDALQSAAQLVTKQSGQRAEYSFVEFVDSAEPVLELQNFWNPLIDPNVVVLNTVHLGKGGDQNMLLTGPNGSGKSANMTGIALSGVILPHAFGIASAEHARATPFTHINTYLNEREDLQQNLSTFMAEAKKLDDICNQITSLKEDERCFTIMDEMLKGTVEEAGAQRVYEAGVKLAQKKSLKKHTKTPQSIVIMATHFEKPTELEVDTAGGFVNYHVGLVEKENGQFKRTFELVRGANLWWFQDAAKRTRFINWLTSLNN